MNALPANPFDLMTGAAAPASGGAPAAGARGQVKSQLPGQLPSPAGASSDGGESSSFAQFLLQVQEQQASSGLVLAARRPGGEQALPQAAATAETGENIAAILARLLGPETGNGANGTNAAYAANAAVLPEDGQGQAGNASQIAAPVQPPVPGHLVAAAVDAALAQISLAGQSAIPDGKAAAKAALNAAAPPIAPLETGQPAPTPEIAAATQSDTAPAAPQGNGATPSGAIAAPPPPAPGALAGGEDGTAIAAPVAGDGQDGVPEHEAGNAAKDKPSSSAPASQDARAAAQAHLPPLPAMAAARAQQMARAAGQIEGNQAPETDAGSGAKSASAAAGNGENSAAAALRAGMAAAAQRADIAASHAPAAAPAQLAAPRFPTGLESQVASDGDMLPVSLTGQTAADGARTAAGVQGAANYTAAATVPVAHLALQIASQARKGLSRFEIRMDPPELGRVDVRLDMGSDGSVTTRMIVERAETLDLLQRDARALERALGDAGFSAGEGSLQFSLKGEGFAGHQDRDGTPGQRADAAGPNGPAIDMQTAQSAYPRAWASDRALDIRV